MEIDEMFKIFKELEETENGRMFLEFAFDLNTFKSNFSSQSEPFCEHIIKLQLYNDSTAYQTIYDIVMRLWKKCRKKKAQQYLDYSFIHEHLIEYTVSDAEEYESVFEEVFQDTQCNYPTVYFRKDFAVFNKIADLCIDILLDIRRPERKQFYEELTEVLG